MKSTPTLIKGDVHSDDRGKLFFNNGFDACSIKRIYCIENASLSIERKWQGHKIEQRWFSAVTGSFKILLIQIDDWVKPTKDLIAQEYIIKSNTLDVLHIPQGYVSSIQALEEPSKLMVMADYFFGEIQDEFRYAQDYFKDV
jgi:hypothetical protein